MLVLGFVFLAVSKISTCFPLQIKPDEKPKKRKYEVVMLKEHVNLPPPGETTQVKKGYYRNFLYPRGIAIMKDQTNAKLAKAQLEEKQAEQDQELRKAMDQRKSIEKVGTFIFEKKVREGSDKIYGSLTPTNVAEKIVVQTAIPVRITAVEIPKINELGEFTGSVDLHPQVSAIFKLKVVPEGWDPSQEEEGDKGGDASEE